MRLRQLHGNIVIAPLIWMTLAVGSQAELRVGASRIDVTPEKFPVLVNGSMRSQTADAVTTRIHARAIVLDDGHERVGICVVDSCMLPKQLCDEAKQLASTQTQLKPERILISATHTHSAPSSMGALGTNEDAYYVSFLRQKIAEALVAAEARLQPARVGWGAAEAANFTALRRWVRRPDMLGTDPFGNPTVRATMHAARNPDEAIGPTGPEDPELSLIAFQSLNGEPIAVLSNFSMHYFGGERPISADYFGYYCQQFEQYLEPKGEEQVVAIMSHGCSGDIWKRDYLTPRSESEGSIQDYSSGLLEIAKGAYAEIEFQENADLAMQQMILPMRYRTPDAQRLEWAERVVQEMGERLPETQPEIYAREQLFLHQLQETEIVLQAIRIGDIAIATTPNETYALTGLKIKLQSPLEKTMVIELANGGDGYVPPPEQHALGGYNTWPARSAGLEVTAEPKIVAGDLLLLEQVCDQPRRVVDAANSLAKRQILEMQPYGYWCLGEMQPPLAKDASRHARHAFYEPGILFYLDGPDAFSSEGIKNHCVHFAGGRLRVDWSQIGSDFTVSMAFWNGMPRDTRDVLGWMFSVDHEHTTSPSGLHLGLDREARLLLRLGKDVALAGSTPIPRWQWQRVVLVKSGDACKVLLAGAEEAELSTTIKLPEAKIAEAFFGGRSDNASNWEGCLDEVVIFDRVLNDEELQTLLELKY